MSDRICICDGELRATFRTDSGHTMTVLLSRGLEGRTYGLAISNAGSEDCAHLTADDMLAVGECIKSLAARAKEEGGGA